MLTMPTIKKMICRIAACERYMRSISDDGCPAEGQPVWAHNVNFGWREPTVYKTGKFWGQYGILAGIHIPNVTHWQELRNGDPL